MFKEEKRQERYDATAMGLRHSEDEEQLNELLYKNKKKILE